MIVVPFRAWHLDELRLQPAQMYLDATIRHADYGPALEAAGPAFSAVHGDTLLGCAGLAMKWEGCAEAWALLTDTRNMLPLHRAVMRFLDTCDLRRIETGVKPDHGAGHRWARMLGFVQECVRAGYMADGGDLCLYARVRHVGA